MFDKPLPVSSTAHAAAHKYWASCSNTFIANREYYETCEAVLKGEILSRLGKPHRVLDLGCGNGQFTFMLATVAEAIDACDLSGALIEQARQRAQDQAVKNVRLWVEDIIWMQPRQSAYDLASCMGVLSTVVDDWAYRAVIRTLRTSLRPGGLLLLRESLSLLPEGQLVESETYATRYRNEEAYRREFEQLGMVLEYEALLAEFGTSVNRFLLYRVAGEPASAQ
jgi:2-polyprenyl-3-methyl-5-hydroxy-6-metoxy-1,4-benzoquinol methylase